jgi:hypothetical protein
MARISGNIGTGKDHPSTPVETVLKKLAPWKEMITIIVFFAGGALWLVGYFETKAKVKELRCFAHESIRLARSEVTLRTTYDEVSALSDKVADLEKKKLAASITESENFNLKRYSRDLTDLKEKRTTAQKKFDDAEARLLDSACSVEDSK